MALLTLVRHGQASFLEDDYDKLSPLGEQQGRILGEYWVRTGTRFDQVYYGPARRHVGTGEAAAAAFHAAGQPWPQSVDVPELNEYPGIAVTRHFLPGPMKKHEDIRPLERQFLSPAAKPTTPPSLAH